MIHICLSEFLWHKVFIYHDAILGDIWTLLFDFLAETSGHTVGDIQSAIYVGVSGGVSL
jgi:hypothetical protein